MSGDLVNLTGGVSKVLRKFPNGGSTSTLPTFNSLANLLTICRRQRRSAARGCSRRPARPAAPRPRHARSRGQHRPLPLARRPRPLQALARAPPCAAPGSPPSARAKRPTPGRWRCASKARRRAWTARATSRSTPKATSGSPTTTPTAASPGSPPAAATSCFRFTPTGQTYPGSPYVGGGLSGVGFGVAVDLSERVWAANFGFEGKGCKTAANHTSVSLFNTAGETLSPEGGWEVGGISWPQGTVVDRHENVWLANCGNDSVTRIDGDTVPASPEGTPPTAVNFPGAAITAGTGAAFERPFADALDARG